MQGSSDDEFRVSGYRSMVQETEGTEAQGIVTGTTDCAAPDGGALVMHDEATFFTNEVVGFFWGEPMDVAMRQKSSGGANDARLAAAPRWPCVIRRFCAVGGGVADGGGGADDAEAARRWPCVMCAQGGASADVG